MRRAESEKVTRNCQSFSQSSATVLSKSVRTAVRKSVSQSVSPAVRATVSQSVSQSFSQPSVIQSVRQSETDDLLIVAHNQMPAIFDNHSVRQNVSTGLFTS